MEIIVSEDAPLTVTVQSEKTALQAIISNSLAGITLIEHEYFVEVVLIYDNPIDPVNPPTTLQSFPYSLPHPLI
jgi:hypothetical protein